MNDLIEPLKEEYNQELQKANELNDAYNSCASTSGQNQPQSCQQTLSQNSLAVRLALEDEVSNLNNSIIALRFKYGTLMSQDFAAQCGVPNLFSSDYEKYGSKQTTQVQEQLAFIKTDNGWVLNSQP